MKDPQFPNKRIQKHDWFARFRDRFVDHEDLHERPQATAEDKDKLQADFQRLGEIFEGIPVTWIIDGAPNISIRRGNFIGLHKDIDVSFEKNELEILEKELAKRGYGFFWSYRKDGEKVMERVSADDYKKDAPKKKRIIAAIDEQGSILSEVPLPNIEVHIIKRDEAGTPLGIYAGRLPEKWLQPVVIDFNDTKLNISHSARIAYFKLYSTFRAPYHQKDLEELVKTGSLTIEDVDDIEKVVKEELGNSKDEKVPLFMERLGKLREMVKSVSQQ